MKKSKKIKIVLIVFIVVLIMGLLIYKFVPQKEEPEVKTVKKITGYNYELKENETRIYKDEFKNLESILSKVIVDEEEYAKSIAKLFIIDFYTLNNKVSKNDVGGAQFIKEDMRDNFIEEARSTFYKYLEVKSKKRTQKLPEVSEISDISIESTTFTIANEYNKITTTTKKGTSTNKGKQVEAYKVMISWDYVEDLGYEKSANMIIVKEGKSLYIVEMD